jgi:hypothetical protein
MEQRQNIFPSRKSTRDSDSAQKQSEGSSSRKYSSTMDIFRTSYRVVTPKNFMFKEDHFAQDDCVLRSPTYHRKMYDDDEASNESPHRSSADIIDSAKVNIIKR